MKILYGVHTIGFGHLSAALALVPQLKQRGANVTCYLCGRDPSQLPDLPQLRPYTTHRGADVPFTDGKLNQMGYYASLAANVAQVVNAGLRRVAVGGVVDVEHDAATIVSQLKKALLPVSD